MINRETKLIEDWIVPVALASTVVLIFIFWCGVAAYGEPTAVPKVGSCPSGYASGATYCTPMSGTTQTAIVKVGSCPSNWTTSGAYCLSPPRR